VSSRLSTPLVCTPSKPVEHGRRGSNLHIKQRVPETKVLFMAVHASHIDDALEADTDGIKMKNATR